MQFFQTQYEHLTNTSKDEIIKELRKRIEAQKKDKSFLKWDLVNYKCFKIIGDRIEVRRTPSLLSPYKSIGTIYFDLIDIENGTNIKCTIQPFNKYALILFSCIFSIFLLVFSALILISLWSEMLKAFTIIAFTWIVVCGIPYITFRFSVSGLVDYSKTILDDLGIKNIKW